MELEQLKREAYTQFEKLMDDEALETGGEVGVQNIKDYFEEVLDAFAEKLYKAGLEKARLLAEEMREEGETDMRILTSRIEAAKNSNS